MALDVVRIVCSDLCTNALGRALLLADLLAVEADVEILGFRNHREIWQPAQAFRIPIRDFRLESAWQYPAAARWLRQKVRSARVVAHKPLTTSLGLALQAGVRPHSLLIDIDDWEIGLLESTRFAGLRGPRRAFQIARDWISPRCLNSYASTWSFDRSLSTFPHRVVSNDFLQRRFGGDLLPHVRDTTELDPARVSGADIRARLELDGRVWVGFIGTPRAHKGLDELVDALGTLSEEAAPGLLLAGADPRDAFSAALIERAQAALGAQRLRTVAGFDFSELPRWVAAADIICLPSRDTPAAHGQIPAKLFDAMAMAKAIVATRVSDMPRILDGCGIIVDPGDLSRLASVLSELSRDADRRAQLGRAARARAVASYSYEAGRRTLRQALQGLEPVK